jgi:arylformamidase
MAIDYEVEYNNRARVPEHPAIFERWKADAGTFRVNHRNAELGLAYGPSPRQHLDLFWPDAARDARIVTFIHGGYWRSLDPFQFSHLAAGPNKRGLAVAMIGYDLCPSVTVAQIIEQIRSAVVFLGKRHGGPILVCGHSAGGHLAACMVATDWPARDPALRADLTAAGLSLSGVFDLEPLVHTSMNSDLRLDPPEARRVSPMHWKLPAGARAFEAWVGAQESAEFLRQSRHIADAWRGGGIAAGYHEVGGANHFTIIDPLVEPDSPLTERLVELSRG